MKARNALLSALPYPVEKSLKKLGSDLKTARVRRRLTTEDVAQKIGASRFAIAQAEKGRASTTIAIYAALLWTYGLIDRLGDIIDPAKDEEGLTLSRHRETTRARRQKLANDF